MAYSLNTHYPNGTWVFGEDVTPGGFPVLAGDIKGLVEQIELGCWMTAFIANGRPSDTDENGVPGVLGGPPPSVRVDINANKQARYLYGILAQVSKSVNKRYPSTDPDDMGDIFSDPGLEDENPPAFKMTVKELSDKLGVTNATAKQIVNGGYMQAAMLAVTVIELAYPSGKRDCVLYGLFAGLTAAAVLSVALRMFARRTISGCVRVYDWAIVVALIFSMAWGILAIIQANLMSRRLCFSTLNQIFATEKYFTVLDILYPIALFVIKLSLLVFYSTLTPWKPLRYATIIAFIFTMCSTAFSIAVAVKSYSLAYYWPQLAQLDYTFDLEAVWLRATVAAGAIGILNDVVIWLLPIPMIWMLQLNIRERSLAILTFGFGLLACIASGLRIRAVWVFLNPLKYYSTTDQYYTAVDINKWTMVEINLSIICSSVPALRVLAAKYMPGLVSSTDSSSGGQRLDLREITLAGEEVYVDSNGGAKLEATKSGDTRNTGDDLTLKENRRLLSPSIASTKRLATPTSDTP